MSCGVCGHPVAPVSNGSKRVCDHTALGLDGVAPDRGDLSGEGTDGGQTMVLVAGI
ncbi:MULTISPECIES: NADH pyrophosphatase zinc ribbon domain-containing protein [Pseudomonas]|uniref:NADH pyrophosphatase zinc ribbon domain-containing protein n=1 Tax=Pseudomonas TaxID=286 RepID=UPI0018C6E085|nr:hypothetical protein [Pseudomonas mohnii]